VQQTSVVPEAQGLQSEGHGIVAVRVPREDPHRSRARNEVRPGVGAQSDCGIRQIAVDGRRDAGVNVLGQVAGGHDGQVGCLRCAGRAQQGAVQPEGAALEDGFNPDLRIDLLELRDLCRQESPRWSFGIQAVP